jgi:glycosyltransferase involved in cell wall biosynthesis
MDNIFNGSIYKSRVSIILSAYNESSVILNAIKSIREQHFIDWELIVVNDGSTDITGELVNQEVRKDSRIRLINNEINQGLAASLNKGIAVSTGEYIARMDADDLALKERLRLQVDYLDEHPDVMVLGGAAIYRNSQGKVLGEVFMPEEHSDIIRWLLRSSPFIHPTVMMRKSFVDVTSGYDESLNRAQDYDLWFRGQNVGIYHNLQRPILIYVQKEKRSLRSLFDSYKVRRRNVSGIKNMSISLFWLVISLVMRIVRR